jgi:hypothetical protein
MPTAVIETLCHYIVRPLSGGGISAVQTVILCSLSRADYRQSERYGRPVGRRLRRTVVGRIGFVTPVESCILRCNMPFDMPWGKNGVFDGKKEVFC